MSLTLPCRSDDETCESSDSECSRVDFSNPVGQADEDEEWEPSAELLRLVEQEEKEIKPHQDRNR